MNWARLLAVGAVAAVLIFSAGYSLETYEKSRLPDLMLKCKSVPSATESWEPPEVKAERCNPALLAKLDPGKLSSLQREIVDAQSWERQAAVSTLPIAIVVFIILALPFAWYFLLDRVRELRHAITGK